MSSNSYIPKNKNSHPSKIQVTQQEKKEIYTGPIPHPDILKGFAEVDSSFPERIMKMAEKHNEANIRQQNRFSWSATYIPLIGQIFTFLLGIGGIIFGVFLAMNGSNGASIASIITGLSPILISAITNILKK